MAILDRLLTVKSIVTFILTLVFGFLAIRGDVTGQEFLTVFSVVIAFYFGTQNAKNQAISTGTEVTSTETESV